MTNNSDDGPSPDEIANRVAWFNLYCTRLNDRPKELPLRCPCCGCKTLTERGVFDICPVCFWEDDGQDDYDADVVRGGPNGGLSLTEARLNFKNLGACDERCGVFVRPPQNDELPDDSPNGP